MTAAYSLRWMVCVPSTFHVRELSYKGDEAAEGLSSPVHFMTKPRCVRPLPKIHGGSREQTLSLLAISLGAHFGKRVAYPGRKEAFEFCVAAGLLAVLAIHAGPVP